MKTECQLKKEAVDDAQLVLFFGKVVKMTPNEVTPIRVIV